MNSVSCLASARQITFIGCLSMLVTVIAVDCAASRVFVANGSSSGTIVSVDSSNGAPVGSPLNVGYSPRPIAVSPSGDRAYVVNRNSGSDPQTPGSVSVVSVADWRVVATVPVGSSARSAALLPNGAKLFVVSSLSSGPLSGTLWMIDTTTFAVRSLDVGESAHGVAIDPSGTLVYVGSTGGVDVVSASSFALLYRISLQATGDSGARHIAVSPDGRYLYVTELIGSITQGNVVVIDAAARSVVARIPIQGVPDTVALSHDGRRLYVGLRNSISSVVEVSTVAHRTEGYIALGSQTEGLALTPDGRELWVMLDGARLVAVDTATRAVTKSVTGLTGAASHGSFIGPRTTPAGTSSVVEFYHRDLDHYFITPDAGEIRALDQGTQPGWARTGQSFFAFPPAAGTNGQPVCRYYGLPAAGLNSHFYSASADECAHVAAQFPGAWQLEASNVFGIAVPSNVGECPAGTEPVYRLWNSRRDSNHRYTMNAGIRDAMVAKGYVSEGYGPQGVAMCGVAAQ